MSPARLIFFFFYFFLFNLQTFLYLQVLVFLKKKQTKFVTEKKTKQTNKQTN